MTHTKLGLYMEQHCVIIYHNICKPRARVALFIVSFFQRYIGVLLNITYIMQGYHTSAEEMFKNKLFLYCINECGGKAGKM